MNSINVISCIICLNIIIYYLVIKDLSAFIKVVRARIYLCSKTDEAFVTFKSII